MAKHDTIKTGQVNNLHFGHSSHGAHAVHGVVPAHSAGRGPKRPRRGGGAGIAFVMAAAVAIVVVAGCWWFMWRDIDVTVNDGARSVRVGTSLSDFLKDNKNFGAKPGRLLSIGGNVISETGGEACAVNYDGELLKSDQLPERKLHDGDVITVKNGSDVTEGHTEKQQTVAPTVQMKTGGAIQYVSQWGKAGKKTVWVGKKSGETVDKKVDVEPTDMIVESVNPSPKDGQYMALTFDDGPSEYTPKILDILKEKGVHATFYNLGNSANKYPDYTKRLVEEGNELASHTMQHQDLPTLDRESLRSEITKAFDAVNKASGRTVQMIRAPYGAFTATEWGRCGDLISCNVLWNIDTLDWKRPGADAIKNNVLGHAKNGRIALMHDGGGDRSQDVDALPGIIDGLTQAGYKLVTVQELMKLDGRFPESVVKGTVTMPKDAALPAN